MSSEFGSLDARHLESAEAQSRKELAELQHVDDEDFKWLMADTRGRRLMWRQLLGPTGVFRNPYAGERGATDFNCGQMNVGQMLIAKIHSLCPEHYTRMMKEIAKHERRRT